MDTTQGCYFRNKEWWDTASILNGAKNIAQVSKYFGAVPRHVNQSAVGAGAPRTTWRFRSTTGVQ